MSGNLVLHTGGWEATREQIDAVPLPEKTPTYQPVGHGELVDTILRAGTAYGWTPQRQRFALARNGAQFFGLIDFQRPGTNGEIGLTVGGRNAHDMSFSVGILGGGNVFLCDNLAFSGDWARDHKHTPGVWDALYAFLFGQMGKIGVQHEKLVEVVAEWRKIDLGVKDSDHLLVECVRRGALPCSDLPKVLKEYDRPTIAGWNDEPRNPWRLYNAFTQVSKAYSPLMQIERVRGAHKVFAEVLA